jgi:ABC-type transport system involved in multi-copper enzyme maturation permease subunit
LAAANIGGEYSWGTLRTILARGVGRGKFLGAKVLALILVIASWALITVILAAAFGILISLIEGSGFRWDYVNLTGLWRFVEVYAKAVYSIIPYLLLAVLCSVIGRSTTVGIVVGILYTLVVDGVLVTVLKFLGDDWIRIANHSIGTSTKVLLTFYPIEIPNIQNMPPEMQQKIMQQLLSMPGQWEAAATILGYCVVFFGIAWYVFKRRDIKFA